jgi:hypothetical protein
MIECRQKLTSEKIMAAHKTAITRKKLSKPARYLKDNELLRGRVLDYGCGRGGDTERIGCEGYDPHFRPEQPVGKFDTIMCNFVLNVIESPKAIERVIRDIQGRLTKYEQRLLRFVPIVRRLSVAPASEHGRDWSCWICRSCIGILELSSMRLLPVVPALRSELILSLKRNRICLTPAAQVV